MARGAAAWTQVRGGAAGEAQVGPEAAGEAPVPREDPAGEREGPGGRPPEISAVFSSRIEVRSYSKHVQKLQIFVL